MKFNIKKVKFNEDGLIPVVAQDYKTNEVLMVAYMNKEALLKTMKTGKVHYYSRSRKKLWLKGEQSGNIQEVKEIYIDCDNDTLLVKINQIGDAACHTGYRSCFFTQITKKKELKIKGKKIFNPEKIYGKKQ